MKKILIYSALLTLCACFGGGGGGGGTTHSSQPRAAILDDTVIQSNKTVTTMASEVLIANDGSAITPSINRAATTTQYNGRTYTSHRLDEVRFKIGGEDSYVDFEMNADGKIIALTKNDRTGTFTEETPVYTISQEGRFERTDDTNEFTKSLFKYSLALDSSEVAEIASEHFHDGIELMADDGTLHTSNPAQLKAKMVAALRADINKIKASQKDADQSAPDYDTLHANYLANQQALENAYTEYASQINNATFTTPDEGYAVLTVTSVNAGSSNGLRFADLGVAHLTLADPSDHNHILQEMYSPYVGGYDVLKINPDQLATDTEYTGKVIAGIDHKKKGYGESQDVKEGVYVSQDNAKLTVNRNGSASLVMNNLTREGAPAQHWYTVRMDTTAAGVPTFTIDGTTNIVGAKENTNAYVLPNGTGEYAFDASDWSVLEQEFINHPDNNSRAGATAEINVYGRTATDTEATSRFGFSNEYHSTNNQQKNEVAIYGAFGGTPTPQP